MPGSSVPPPTAARPPLSLRLGDPLIVLGALAVFGFSFAPFVRYSDDAEQALVVALLGISSWFNAWSLETFMAPLTAFVILAALLSLALALTRFLLRREPPVLGFGLRQIEVGLGLFSFFVLLGLVASEKHVVFGARRLGEADPSFNASELVLRTGWGAVVMTIGAAVLALGAILNHFSVGPLISLSSQAQPDPRQAGPPPAAGHQPPPPASHGYGDYPPRDEPPDHSP